MSLDYNMSSMIIHNVIACVSCNVIAIAPLLPTVIPYNSFNVY